VPDALHRLQNRCKWDLQTGANTHISTSAISLACGPIDNDLPLFLRSVKLGSLELLEDYLIDTRERLCGYTHMRDVCYLEKETANDLILCFRTCVLCVRSCLTGSCCCLDDAYTSNLECQLGNPA
jgi:hypothetical protein